MKNLIYLLLVLITFAACKKDNQIPTENPIIPIPDNLVVNPVFIGKWKLTTVDNKDDDEDAVVITNTILLEFKTDNKLNAVFINDEGDIDEEETFENLSYTYDRDDKEISFTADDEAVTFTYSLNSSNKLVLSQEDDEETIEYTYEPYTGSVTQYFATPAILGVYELESTHKLSSLNVKSEEKTSANDGIEGYLQLKQSLLYSIAKYTPAESEEDEPTFDEDLSKFNQDYSYVQDPFSLGLTGYTGLTYSITDGKISISYPIAESTDRYVEVYKKTTSKTTLNDLFDESI